MKFHKLLDVTAPCCHNALKPGPDPAGDPLYEAGGHGSPGGVDTLLQLCHIRGPLLARNTVNVVPDTVLKGCTTRARRWLVLFLRLCHLRHDLCCSVGSDGLSPSLFPGLALAHRLNSHKTDASVTSRQKR